MSEGGPSAGAGRPTAGRRQPPLERQLRAESASGPSGDLDAAVPCRDELAARAFESGDRRRRRGEAKVEAPHLALRRHGPVDPAPRPLRHGLEEAPFASRGERAVPNAKGVDAAGRHGRHVRPRVAYGVGERLLLPIDEELGCGVEVDTRGDRILGAVHPVAGRQALLDAAGRTGLAKDPAAAATLAALDAALCGAETS